MATNFVTVCCKLPAGLMAEIADIKFEDIAGNTVAAKTNVQKIWFRGSADQRRLESNGETLGMAPLVVGGFGITRVEEAFWNQWWAENADVSRGGKATVCYAPIAAGMIFAHPKEVNAKAEAKEKAALRSGLEPIAPPNKDRNGKPIGEVDPRIPKNVQTADKPGT